MPAAWSPARAPTRHLDDERDDDGVRRGERDRRLLEVDPGAGAGGLLIESLEVELALGRVDRVVGIDLVGRRVGAVVEQRHPVLDRHGPGPGGRRSWSARRVARDRHRSASARSARSRAARAVASSPAARRPDPPTAQRSAPSTTSMASAASQPRRTRAGGMGGSDGSGRVMEVQMVEGAERLDCAAPDESKGGTAGGHPTLRQVCSSATRPGAGAPGQPTGYLVGEEGEGQDG